MKTAEELFEDKGFYKKRYWDPKYVEDDLYIYINYKNDRYNYSECEINFKISKSGNNHSVQLVQDTWPDICETNLELLDVLYPIIKQLEEYNIDIEKVFMERIEK